MKIPTYWMKFSSKIKIMNNHISAINNLQTLSVQKSQLFATVAFLTYHANDSYNNPDKINMAN